jgi:hypothetical protein
MPSTAAASVRAISTNPASVLASTAAFTRSIISSFVTTSLPGRCPQRFWPTWSSMCTAATPMRSKLRMVRSDVEGPAPAGVDVHQQGHARGVDDATCVGEHVLHGADAKIGHAQRVCRHAATGQVQRLVAGALGHEAGVGRDRAHHLQRGFFGNGGAETRTSRGVSVHAWVSGVFVESSQWAGSASWPASLSSARHSSRICRTRRAFPRRSARSIRARCTSAARTATSPGAPFRHCHAPPGTGAATA